MSADKPKRTPRRVTKPAPAGSDPAPATSGYQLAGEDQPHSWGDGADSAGQNSTGTSNDERLKRDKPPHWG